MRNWSKLIAISDLHIDVAGNFFQRFLGLMGRRSLHDDRALLIVPCSDIHTAFMRFPIDVVFIDRDGYIIKIVHRLRPWRFALARQAYACLELNSGAAERYQLQTGQSLLRNGMFQRPVNI
ncbi:DUF192 domain-containing protein [Undibacterium sp. CY21W]|uniref:DUF192 domain-containing protein n=1 Tax=Undibacterium sp. CY21W TaxID=2762293 RepID=UPI00164BBC92|nr:DUF192 domain-containing protein [Undibacterium sp. CY21W]MBC3927420.1 DUF192 domain-containing protein [Undibacterium sp. CY21W]